MSAGFDHDPLADVGELHQVLRDQYPASAIPKELIQNADDAKATTLHFAWSPGWSEHEHPLLRCPAIVVLNDGEFRAQDAKAIRYLRLGAKGGDHGTIGKFGLGLKSVFHLGEAFFYFSSSSQPACEDGRPFAAWLSPWGESKHHRDWLGVEKHFGLIQSWLERWPHGHDRWFALWLPLRQRDFSPVIVKQFPRIEDFFTANLPREVCRAFPLLRFVERVNVWTGAEANTPTLGYAVTLNASSTRRRFPDIAFGAPQRVGGRLEGQDGAVTFVGYERLLDDPVFTELQADEAWPQATTIDRKTGEPALVREKADPHVATCFAVSKARTVGHGLLRVTPAVFLPLADSQEVPCGRRYDYELLLHGSYFVDAGRRGLREHPWNDALKQRGAWPLVLPALRDTVAEVPLPDDEVRALTAVLARVLRPNISHVCRDGQWLLRLESTTARWTLAPTDPYYELPAPPSAAPLLPLELFPELLSTVNDRVITFAGAPLLSPEDSVGWVTRDGIWLDEIRKLDVRRAFGARQNLEYLTAFLKAEALRAQPVWHRAARTVVDWLRAAIRDVGLSSLRPFDNQLQALISVVPVGLIIRTRPVGSDRRPALDRLLQLLVGVSRERLIVPAEWLPDHADLGRLQISDTTQALQLLAEDESPISQTRDVRSDLALDLVRLTDGTLEAKRSAFGKYALFRAYSYRANKEVLASWQELEALRSKGRLHAGAEELARVLQGALADASVFRLIDSPLSKAAETLFGQESLPKCTAERCLTILDGRPALTGPEARQSLLKEIIHLHVAVGRRAALRYLLHCRTEAYGDSVTPLLATPAGAGASVWYRLAAGALGQSGESWRILPELLTNELTPNAASDLRVRPVDRESVEDLLRGVADLSWVSELDLRDTESVEILAAVVDLDVWRRLPLHHLSIGGRTSIESRRAYLDGGLLVPEPLATRVTLLMAPASQALAEAYRKHGVPIWDGITAIRESLELDDPWQYCLVILQALAGVDRPSIPSELLDRLRTTAWLPLDDGSVAPADVVCLPPLEGLIDTLRLEPLLAEGFVHATQLPDWVASHEVFEWLRAELFPKPAFALERLAGAAIVAPENCLGHLAALRGDSTTLVAAFDGAGADVCAIAPLLRAIATAYPGELGRFLTAVRMDSSTDVVRRRLEFLATRAAGVAAEVRDQIVAVHVAYTTELVLAAGFTTGDLNDLKFPDRGGYWRPASRLCLDAPSVTRSQVVRSDYADVLRAHVPTALALDSTGRPTGQVSYQPLTGDAFRSFWQGWDTVIAPEVIGGFLALFATKNSSIRALAQEFLGPARDVDLFLSRIERSAAFPTASTHDPQYPFVFDVTDPRTQETVETLNLLGEPFHAQIAREASSILMDLPRGVTEGNKPLAQLWRFRKLEPSEHTREQLLEFLVDAANTFLLKECWAVADNLEDVLSELAETEQLDLAVAQSMILESGFFYLRQLSAAAIPTIRPLILKWDTLRYRLEEERQAHQRGLRVSHGAAEDVDRVRAELRALLESNSEAANELLECVRSKMQADYQYSLASLLFELFQNSDDASVEAEQMDGLDRGAAARTLVALEYDGVALRWMHWGRLINRYRCPTFAADAGRARGFDRDLEKMLVLSSSDKGHGKDVTGRFGLGFKTVFLLADQPVVLSGRLGFRVVAGMFPKALAADTTSEMQARLRERGGETPGTVVELTAADGRSTTEAVTRFLSLVHVGLAFARRIKQCAIRHGDGRTETLSWTDRAVGQATSVRLGTLAPSFGVDARPGGALMLGGLTTRLLLSVNANGFAPLPDTVPTIWVTAPTEHRLDTGFALNGPFALDVGRAHVASSEANTQAAKTAGAELATAFEELFLSVEDWLGTEVARLDRYRLWESLWNLMRRVTSGASPESTIVRKALWSGTGYEYLVRHASALPTGLSGAHRVLTSLPEVRFVTKGLMQRGDVFESIAEWPIFVDRVAPGQVVSVEVAGELRRLVSGELNVEPITLTRLVGWELQRARRCSAEEADRLGRVVTPSVIQDVRRSEDGSGEEALSTHLQDFEFKADDGSWVRAESLLVRGPQGSAQTDEHRRAAFAPHSRVLNQDYATVAAVAFFEACRGSLRAPSDVLFEWGVHATDDSRRLAFLKYLLGGELAAKVGELARAGRQGTWLATLRTDHPLLAEFSGSERLHLLGLIGFTIGDIVGPDDTIDDDTAEPRPHLDVSMVLLWWRQEGHLLTPQYLQRLYPGGRRLTLAQGSREDWLALFLMGIAQTLGRVRPEATRNFVVLCQEQGWLRELAGAHDDPAAWLRLLDEYIDDMVDEFPFQQWIRLLVALFIVGRRLDEYVDAIRSIDRLPPPFSPDQVFNPRTAAVFQGGGPDAAPIAHILGIGSCFVLRELASAKVVSNALIHPYCFVPTRRVRWLVQALGGPDVSIIGGARWNQSAAIYEFLSEQLGAENATFDGAFDLPLQLLAYDSDLLQRVLALQPPGYDEGDEGENW